MLKCQSTQNEMFQLWEHNYSQFLMRSSHLSFRICSSATECQLQQEGGAQNTGPQMSLSWGSKKKKKNLRKGLTVTVPRWNILSHFLPGQEIIRILPMGTPTKTHCLVERGKVRTFFLLKTIPPIFWMSVTETGSEIKSPQRSHRQRT